MALALLKFPDAPEKFRRGLYGILREEQEHLRLYIERMRGIGVEFGEIPVSDFFWRCISPVGTPDRVRHPPQPHPGAGQPRLRPALRLGVRRAGGRRDGAPDAAHLPGRDRPREARPDLVQQLARPGPRRVGSLHPDPRPAAGPGPRQGDRLQRGRAPKSGPFRGFHRRAAGSLPVAGTPSRGVLVQPGVRPLRRPGRGTDAAEVDGAGGRRPGDGAGPGLRFRRRRSGPPPAEAGASVPTAGRGPGDSGVCPVRRHRRARRSSAGRPPARGPASLGGGSGQRATAGPAEGQRRRSRAGSGLEQRPAPAVLQGVERRHARGIPRRPAEDWLCGADVVGQRCGSMGEVRHALGLLGKRDWNRAVIKAPFGAAGRGQVRVSTAAGPGEADPPEGAKRGRWNGCWRSREPSWSNRSSKGWRTCRPSTRSAPAGRRSC